ncbi:SGNH/GDSL hydrolase family protein [Rothia sp. CCM 9416]|uniref:SGNH/GDSL hydrolase family protein n=1 Tax=Rothia sp. CCM 9416 TaxID=3402655 RepID=UPI003AE87D42
MESERGQARTIRLKEFNPGMVRPATPEESYLLHTDGSLKKCNTVLRSDNNGFLVTGNALSGGRKKIAILGDSFVESYWASAETKRWVSVAERCLEDLAPGRFSLLNGGYSGSTSLHMALSLPAKMRVLFTDLAGVILFVPSCDTEVADLKHTYWTKDTYWSPLSPYNHPGDLPAGEFDIYQDIRANWGLMLSYLRAYDVPVVVASSPTRTALVEDDPFILDKFSNNEEFNIWSSRNQRLMRAVLDFAENQGVETIDTYKFPWPLNGSYPFFYDYLHLNDQGQSFFGRLIAEKIHGINLWKI